MADQKSAQQMLQELMDRAEIETLFTGYYSGLGAGDPNAFGRYFAEGAELDVNGVICRGQDEIAKLYADVTEDKPNLTGTFRMILSNLVIEIDGDTARAQAMWSQTLNDTIKGPQRWIEQGMEYDLLTKETGKWLIKRRVVIADSNLPDMMDATFDPNRKFSMADL